jgi:hypothetical protein
MQSASCNNEFRSATPWGQYHPRLYAEYRALEEAKAAARPLTRDEREIFRKTFASARRRGISFDLSEEDLSILVARAAGRCEMTKIRFSNVRLPDQRVRPFRMSVDRLDNNEGYSLRNCRLVCVQANFLRGFADLEAAHLFFMEYARAQGATIPDELVVSRDEDRWRY